MITTKDTAQRREVGPAEICQNRSVLIASPDGWAVWGVVVFIRWWLLVDHCVLRNWDRILVRAVRELISRAGMVSICPLLWQRDVKLQQTNQLSANSEPQLTGITQLMLSATILLWTS